MKHPLAEQARLAMAELRFTEAEQLLKFGLDSDPKNTDLICEALILQCFAMQEKSSARDFKSARGGSREAVLRKLLSEHFYCLTQLNAKLGRVDEEATKFALEFPVKDASAVGTSISAVLIVKNEEKMLARCLESVRSICDQIVVVDTGSSDRTVEIAESFGATMGYFEWNRDFSAARNASLELATGQWALWIDADEVLDPDSFESIYKAIVRPHYGGFNLEIVNYVADDQQDEKFVHTLLRLFRKIEGVRFVEPIHEQVLPSLKALGLPWAHLPGAQLLHYGYQPAVMVEKNKTERTVSMVEARLEENPEDYFQWFNLANAYIVSRDYEKCKAAAEKCIFYMPQGVEFGQLVYQVLITSLQELGEFERAISVANDADTNGCGGILVEYEKANVYIRMRILGKALETLDHALELTWPVNLAGDKGIEIFKRHALKGQILSELGKFTEALKWMEMAIERAPNQPHLQLNRAILFDKIGRREDAILAFENVSQIPRVRVEALLHLGNLYSKGKQYGVAAEQFEVAWRTDTSNVDNWGAWVKHLELAGENEKAVEAYEALDQVSELDAEFRTNFGLLLEKVGLNGRAIDCYVAVIEKHEGYANAYFCYGDLLYRLGRYQDAAGIYQQGLELNPGYSEGWFVFGNSLAQLTFNEAAQRCYEEVLRLQPGHHGARHNLSIVAA